MSKWEKIINYPQQAGWYATVNVYMDGKTKPRYFDNEAPWPSWWKYSNHHDNQTLVPNEAFTHWCELPKYPS